MKCKKEVRAQKVALKELSSMKRKHHSKPSNRRKQGREKLEVTREMLIRFQHQDKRGRKVPGIKIMKWTMTSVLLVLGFTAMMLVQTGSG